MTVIGKVPGYNYGSSTPAVGLPVGEKGKLPPRLRVFGLQRGVEVLCLRR